MKFILSLTLLFVYAIASKADTIPHLAKILAVKNLQTWQRFTNPYVESFSDSTSMLTYEQIKNPAYHSLFSPSMKAYKGSGKMWYRFMVENQTHETHFFLRLEHPWQSAVYLTNGNGEIYTFEQGVNVPKSKRAFGASVQDVLLTLPKGKSSIYISQRYEYNNSTAAFEKYFRLAPYQVLLYQLLLNYVFDAILLGIILIMLIYNLFIYFSVRDKIYPYYLGMIVCFLLNFLFTPQLLPTLLDWSPSVLEKISAIGNLGSSFALVFFIAFTKTYLGIADKNRILFYASWLIGVGAVIVYIGAFMPIGLYLQVLFVDNLLLVIIVLGLIGLSFRVFMSGGRVGKFYFYANILSLLFGLLYLGSENILGFYKDNFYTQNALKIGLIAQLSIFSIALADRINTLKTSITQKTIENEQLEKKQIIEIQQITVQKNIELEQKVKDRTRDLQQLSEEIQTQNEEIRAQADILQVQKQEIEEKSLLLADEKNRQLINVTLQIIQKNELLPEIAKFVEQTSPAMSDEAKKEAKIILKQIKQNTNIDQQWENLKLHFEQVHPTLFSQLLTLCPDLSNYDLRLCAYEKMGLSRKEVSVLLNMNTESIRKQQFRIKQKLNLPDNVSFIDFIKTC